MESEIIYRKWIDKRRHGYINVEIRYQTFIMCYNGSIICRLGERVLNKFFFRSGLLLVPFRISWTESCRSKMTLKRSTETGTNSLRSDHAYHKVKGNLSVLDFVFLCHDYKINLPHSRPFTPISFTAPSVPSYPSVHILTGWRASVTGIPSVTP